MFWNQSQIGNFISHSFRKVRLMEFQTWARQTWAIFRAKISRLCKGFSYFVGLPCDDHIKSCFVQDDLSNWPSPISIPKRIQLVANQSCCSTKLYMQSSYLSRILRIIFVEKKLSCGEISSFHVWQGLASYCKADTTFTFCFSVINA